MPRRPNLTQEQREYLALQYVRCRGPIRHRWDHIIASPDQRPSFGTLALFRCETCTTERHDIFSRITGDLLARWYVYPEGYRDAQRHTAAEYRAIWAEQEYANHTLLDAEDNVRPIRKRKKA